MGSLLFCYRLYHEFYNTTKTTKSIETSITFKQGILTKAGFKRVYDGSYHIIVIDNLLELFSKSHEMQQLFTKYCYHLNISAIFMSQNIFQQGPHARSIILNYFIFRYFANKRDDPQIHTSTK